jgi:hypothetical protein
MSDSNDGTSELYDDSEEASPSVVGGVVSAMRAVVPGRVTFGRRISVRGCVEVSLPERRAVDIPHEHRKLPKKMKKRLKRNE